MGFMETAYHLKLLKNRWLMLAIWTFLVLPVSLASAFVYSQKQQSAIRSTAHADIASRVEFRIDQVYGLLNSIVSTHYATSGDQSALVAMAEQLRADNPMITAVGRYEKVPINAREHYQESMEISGLYDWRIVDLVDGRRVPSPERVVAWPVSFIDPMTPEFLPLLGSDLAVENALVNSLPIANVHNSTVAIHIPDRWPAANQLILFQPAYRGRIVPEQYSERMEQADGGYFFIIDPRVYLQGVLDRASQSRLSNLSLSIKKQSVQHVVAKRQFHPDELLGAQWLQPMLIRTQFLFGDASLILLSESVCGIPRGHLLPLLTIVILASALFLAGLLWIQGRSRAAKFRNLEVLQNERNRTEHTLHLIGDAVITVDHQGVIQHVNTAGLEFFGSAAIDLVNKPLDDHLHLRHREGDKGKFNAAQLLAQMRSSDLLEHDLVPDADKASDKVYRCIVSLNEGSAEHAPTAVFVIRDTSAETRLTTALEYQANHDSLTGCANRYRFERRLDKLMSSQATSSNGNALLYVDLDQFKIVNDSAGHTAGDRMLVHVAEELGQIVDSSDMLARLGGDEFGLLMVDVDLAEAELRAQRVHDRFQIMVFSFQGRAFPVRASLGLVHSDDFGESATELFASADMACYAAKDMGRNRLYVYQADDVAMTQRSKELQWLPLLRQALEESRFRLYAQPLVEIQCPQYQSRYELLLRLTDDEGNELSASRIVDAAERYGLMCEIDRWVINQAFAIISSLKKESSDSNVNFSINLSGQSAADPALIEYIYERIHYHQVDPVSLSFEITETAAISHFANAIEFSQAMRKMGVKIALDDFGSGLSSFAYLKRLPVDILKIDGQFIQDIANNVVDVAMVKAIRDVAHSMQITTVAEFVENQSILDVLTDIGIDVAQGYHLGKPLPVNKALRERNISSNPMAVSL